jgi:autotransporter passenger strand-loop-strand repeat protein
VSSGQTLTISAGQTVSGLVVLNGGTLIVLSGGTVSDTIDSGTEILSGGLDIGATVAGGGVLNVSSGGFIPAPNPIGSSSSFTYTVTDPAGNSSAGNATATVAAEPTTSLFDFVFTYADGKDYYGGTVADSGGVGYRVGQRIATSAGHYDIFNKEGGSTTAPSGTVVVANYSHGGPGVASTVPVDTAAGRPDGTGGLGSESDAVRGTDGQPHAFSSTQEVSFATTAQFGFVYSYADGAAFYSGVVADDGTFGLSGGPGATFSRTVSDNTGQVLGTYSIFSDGVSTLAPGAAVIDRFTAGDAPFLPNHAGAGAVNGSAGLGSEVGAIAVSGVGVGFSADQEPRLMLSVPTVPDPPMVAQADVISNEVTEIFRELLGRDPVAGELASYSAALAGDASVATLRQTIAGSVEGQNGVNALHNQLFGQNFDPSGLASFTGFLDNGSSLPAVQLILAQSPEALNDIGALYQDVLARAPDGGELTTSMADLAGGTSLTAVRGMVAHSREAANDLTQLFQGILTRPPGAAELVGMEDLLGRQRDAADAPGRAPGQRVGRGLHHAHRGHRRCRAERPARDPDPVCVQRHRLWPRHDRRVRSGPGHDPDRPRPRRQPDHPQHRHHRHRRRHPHYHQPEPIDPAQRHPPHQPRPRQLPNPLTTGRPALPTDALRTAAAKIRPCGRHPRSPRAAFPGSATSPRPREARRARRRAPGLLRQTAPHRGHRGRGRRGPH